MTKKAIILLSGGIDSLVSLDIVIKKYNVVNSLTFDYGQKAFKEEKDAAKKIAKYYGIKNEVIKLSFLKDILDNALVDDKKQDLNDFSQIWIPNRNGLFLNIAACYCDKYEIDCIVFGANKEEAEKFSDNSLDFIKTSDKFFKYSTAIAAFIIPIIGLAEVGEEMVLVESSGVNTRFWLWGLVTCIPTVLGLLSLIPYKFYDLEGDKLKMIQEENRKRQEAIIKEAE